MIATKFPGHGCMDDLTTESNFDSQASFRPSICLAVLDMLPMGVCTTGHRQTSGRLIQVLNVCTVLTSLGKHLVQYASEVHINVERSYIRSIHVVVKLQTSRRGSRESWREETSFLSDRSRGGRLHVVVISFNDKKMRSSSSSSHKIDGRIQKGKGSVTCITVTFLHE